MPRTRGGHTEHSTLQTELIQSWLLVLMPDMEPEVGKIKITETQNDGETIMLFLGFSAGSSFNQWHLLYSSDPAQPVQPSFLAVLCPVGHLSSTLENGWELTNTTQQIKVLPAPSALPQ